MALSSPPTNSAKSTWKISSANPKDETVVYFRISEQSSHTWFVLTYLLGFSDVKNYDGSWTEWGNSVRAPIEREP